jgi:hypothetical protein
MKHPLVLSRAKHSRFFRYLYNAFKLVLPVKGFEKLKDNAGQNVFDPK